MKVHYDSTVDAIDLRLGDSKIVESEGVRPGIVLGAVMDQVRWPSEDEASEVE